MDAEIVTTKKELPADMIRLAIEKGSDLSKLEQLMSMQERFEANEARKLYNKQLASVHKKIPAVAKTLKNAQTNSKYASLDTIIERTREVYTSFGFSVCFYEGDTAKPNHVRICADLKHEAGHSESYFYDVPLDGTGIKGNQNMTAIHGKASSVSYGRRYLMCMIFNIPTGDDDDGAAAGGVELINDKELNQLLDLIADRAVEQTKFLAFMKIESLEKMPRSKFKQAVAAIEARKPVQK